MKHTIKDIVKDRNAYYVYYRQNTLYYAVDMEDGTYMFPIPTEDLMEASVNATERAITLMRYIRKAVNSGSFVRYYA